MNYLNAKLKKKSSLPWSPGNPGNPGIPASPFSPDSPGVPGNPSVPRSPFNPVSPLSPGNPSRPGGETSSMILCNPVIRKYALNLMFFRKLGHNQVFSHSLTFLAFLSFQLWFLRLKDHVYLFLDDFLQILYVASTTLVSVSRICPKHQHNAQHNRESLHYVFFSKTRQRLTNFYRATRVFINMFTSSQCGFSMICELSVIGKRRFI